MTNKIFYWLILIFGSYACLLIFPTLGAFNLFDWDEINFAESSREMLQSRNYFQVQVNFEPFHEKPPLFFWLQFLSMKLFGVNAFAARFPNALLAIITPVILFKMGQKLKNNTFGIIWSITFLCGILPSMYFRTGIIDPYFNLFIFISLFFYFHAISTNKNKSRNILLAGFFAGLGLITKGPVALLIILLAAVVYFLNSRKFFSIKQSIFFILVLSLTSIIWYGYEIYNKGFWFLVEFVKYQIELFSTPVAGHQQPVYYHILVLLFGCFPFSFFAFKNCIKSSGFKNEFEKMMRILFWVVLILFTVVSTKIIHYSSMAYFPLSFLAALELYKIRAGKKMNNNLKFLLVGFGTFISLLLSLLIYLIVYNKQVIIKIIKDPNVHQMVNQQMKWNGLEWLIPLFFLLFSLVWLIKIHDKLIYQLLFSMFMLGGFLSLSAYYIVPNVGKMTQGSAIEFYQSISKNKKYLMTVGFKSYAHYFYGEVDELSSNDKLYLEKNRILKDLFRVKSLNELSVSDKIKFNSHVLNWLVNDRIDRPAYFVTKINRPIPLLENSSNITRIKNEGGFIFYKRNLK